MEEERADIGRFQLVANFNTLGPSHTIFGLLIDTTNGRSWRLEHSAIGQFNWVPLPYAGDAPKAP